MEHDLLRLLGEFALSAPSHVSELLQQVRSLEHLIQEFGDEYEEWQPKLLECMINLSESCRDFASENLASQNELNIKTQHLESALQAVSESLATRQAEVTGVLEQAKAHSQSARVTAQGMSGKIAAIVKEIQQEQNELQLHLDSQLEHFAEQIAGLRGQMVDFRDAVEVLGQNVEQRLEAVSQTIDAQHQTLTHDIEGLSSQFVELQEEFEDQVTATHEELLADGFGTLGDQAEEKVDHEFKEALNDAIESLCQVIKDIEQKFSQDNAENQRCRKPLEDAVNELKPLIEPLISLSESVSSVVRRFDGGFF